jgi:3-dehydroquinate synthase class II
MEPDLAGFRDASVRLRGAMGRPLWYMTPTPTTWPPGTALDPQSGQPYDPTIVPLASGFTSASAQTLVVLPGATDRAAKDIEAAIGRIEEGEAALVIGSDDWQKLSLEDATGVVIYDDDWELRDARFDSVGGAGDADRVIVHAVQRSRTMNQGS